MNTKQQSRPQKSFKAFYALIFIELSVLGIIKLSIGEIFSFPITFLFGDLFLLFYAVLGVASLLYLLFPRVFVLKRKAVAPLLILIAFILSATLFSLARGSYVNDGAYFVAQIENYFATLKTNLSINREQNIYFSSFGGFFGEALALVFRPLGQIGSVIVLSLVLTVTLFFLFLPLFRLIVTKIKTTITVMKKRERVLKEAAFLHKEAAMIDVSEREEKRAPEEEIAPIKITKKVDETASVPFLKPVTDREEIKVRPPLIDHGGKGPTVPDLNFDEGEVVAVHEQLNTEEETVDLSALASGLAESEAARAELEEETVLRTVTLEREEESAPDEVGAPHFAPITEEAKEETAPPLVSELVRKPKVVEQPVSAPKVTLSDPYAHYVKPSLNLLFEKEESEADEENELFAEQNKEIINQVFRNFNVGAEVVGYTIGASFTRFDIQTDDTVSVNAITPYIKDISVRMSGVNTRFEQVVTGRTTSGLEAPNKRRTIVSFRECMEALPKRKNNITIPLGKDVAGDVLTASFDDFPHLLVAGATGSGKSVFVHSVLMSLIMQNNPNELRLVIIDPKRVELSKYNDIPHLLGPIIKEPSEAKVALNRLVDEMVERYKVLEEAAASNIKEYNEMAGELDKPLMPYIIVIVDEYADLYESEKEIATPILLLAQKSRAAGIFLLIATQRPSVQIITGIIKANLPSRVAFMTASSIDSQTIIGVGGAEQLLGNGDMLVESNSALKRKGLVRIQGAYVRPNEIVRVVKYLRDNYPPTYDERFVDLEERQALNEDGYVSAIHDEMYPEVVRFVKTQDTISISRIQTIFRFGFNRARQFYMTLLEQGIIEQPEDAKSSKGARVVGSTYEEQ